jgi:hypothetical protein
VGAANSARRDPTSKPIRQDGTVAQAGDIVLGRQVEELRGACVLAKARVEPSSRLTAGRLTSSRRLRLPILRAKHGKRRPGMERLSGKTALVIGSTDGVGRLVALDKSSPGSTRPV